MNTPALDALCRYHGIAPDYTDIWGQHHRVSDTTRRALLRAMGVEADSEQAARASLARSENANWRRTLPAVQVIRAGAAETEVGVCLPAAGVDADWRWTLTEEGGRQHEGAFIPAALAVLERRDVEGTAWLRVGLKLPVPQAPGYHHLEVAAPNSTAGMALIVAPPACYQPEAVSDGGRVWGLGIQLFALRSRRNWGIGDFTDLTRVLEYAAREGAGVIGVNPLNALFPHNPRHAGPYGPSSRLFLNILYLDVEAVPDFAECDAVQQQVASPEFQARLRALRAAELVDYAQVAEVKLEVLRHLYDHFREHHLEADNERGAAFRRYRARQGQALQQHARYEALQAHFHGSDPGLWGWPVWPEALRRPDSDAVARFAEAHAGDVGFYEYLQWQSELQLDSAGRRAFELGLGVGIYQDLPLGVDSGGSEAWANQECYALQARIGSPPDDFNLRGQDWGLPPWIPERLRATAYAPFIATLRRNMRTAGALRIDHVMSLLRLFWIPPGGTAADGAYVYYRLPELLGILALESHRNHCLVIGEDLGTVPDEVRRALQPAGVLSYRLLYFEKDARGAFHPPAEYPSQTLVAVSTHDLPTLAGFWSGHDLELRRRLDLFPTRERYEALVIGRAEDRARLLLALQREGLLGEEMDQNPASLPEMTVELAHAIHLYLARTPARLLMVYPEDLLGQTEQVNLPGTTDEHPNWQRKLTLEIESWAEEPRLETLFAALRRIRGTAVRPPPLPAPERPVPGRAEIPRATYRLQFNRDFSLDDAVRIVPYLHRLGISHCYASPLLKARPGSQHGYDIVEHDTLNPELGGRAAFERFTDALHAHGMGLLLDTVPNHMGIMGRDNPWWLDILENGPASRYAGFFDIDWNPLKEELRGKVLLPLLGDHYGNILDRGELQLCFEAGSGAFAIDYYEHRLPVDPQTYPLLFRDREGQLAERLGAGHPRALEFASLMTALGKLPPRHATAPQAVAERERDKELHKQRLAELYAGDADISRYVDEVLRDFNGGEDYPPDPVRFHELLQAQAWRLAFWRVAADQINYRRFFDINELAALRMENRAVFDATHGLLLELIANGRLQGLRIDHPDGLFDPAGYFRRVQESVARLARAGINDSEAGAETRPFYLVVEKILAAGEHLPGDWPVHGATGYEFARQCDGLYVAQDAAAAMERCYADFVGERLSYAETAYLCRRLIMQEALASELAVLATELARIAESDIHTRDFTRAGLHEALATIIACFPVYRTYVDAGGPSAGDAARIEQAVGAARRRSHTADATIFAFVHDVLLCRQAEGKDAAYRNRVARFAMKFQQYTSPVAAKGVEDTAFYRYNRLVSLNEVGGEPARFGGSLADFHQANARRGTDWPHTLLCLSTHDTKRSADVRARIHVLSELPAEWRARVNRWAALNRPHKRLVDDRACPSANDEYLFYQTLTGLWPLQPPDAAQQAGLVERVQAYMRKAVREAKQHTSWLNPDTEYESALHGFIAAVLDPATGAGFLGDFLPLQRRISRIGLLNSLSQTLLTLTAPGVPDIYQGAELWDFSLVDPDNRRGVDFEKRSRLLEELEAEFAAEAPAARLHDLLARLEDGRGKLFVIWKCLALRARQPALFESGVYTPLHTGGARARHLCAFARRHGDTAAIAVAPRLIAGLAGDGQALPVAASAWGDTWIELPDPLAQRQYRCQFTGADQPVRHSADGYRLQAAGLFAHFPLALLCDA